MWNVISKKIWNFLSLSLSLFNFQHLSKFASIWNILLLGWMVKRAYWVCGKYHHHIIIIHAPLPCISAGSSLHFTHAIFILIFCNMLLNIYYLSYYSYNRLTFTQENVENVMCVWCVRGLCFLKGALPLKRLTIVTKIERTLVLATSLHFLTYLTSVSISISQNDSLVSQHLHSLNEWISCPFPPKCLPVFLWLLNLLVLGSKKFSLSCSLASLPSFFHKFILCLSPFTLVTFVQLYHFLLQSS